jgi:hypothetical protein
VNLPEGVTATNVRPGPRPDVVTVDLDIDVSLLLKGMGEAFKKMGTATERAARSLRSLVGLLRGAANDEVRVAGLEARYYVRGGLSCPLGLTGIDRLVRDLVTCPEAAEPGEEVLLRLLTRENRVLLAVAAIRGYVESTDEEPSGLLPWHRYMSGTRVVVQVG